MTTAQLKYFITAAECLNFTEAGRRHFISQTAITQHIQALEQQLGVKLFIRRKRHVELTAAGQIFLTEARAILERTNSAIEKVGRVATGFIGNVNVGYFKCFEGSGFHEFVRKFYEDNPNIAMYLYRNNNLDLLLQLKQRKLDFAFCVCYENTDISDFESMPITTCPLYAALYSGHPLSGRSSIRRNELKDDPFFLTRFYDDPTAKDFILPEKYAASGFIPKIRGNSQDIETLLLLVNAGLGVTVIPEPACSFLKGRIGVTFVPLEGEYEYVDIRGLWLKENHNPALESLISYIGKNISSF